MNGAPPVEQDFAGKVAFVTGAASGVGAATVLALARRGAAVAVADRDADALAQLATRLDSEAARHLSVAVDVADPASVERGVAQAASHFGALHLAVNNAGIAGPKGPAGEYGLEDWRRVIDINLNGVFYCMRAEIAAILESGGGAIVNLASIIGVVGTRGAVAYAAAKHGVIGMTRVAALDYAERNIRINAVAPGYVDTPMINTRDPALIAGIPALHPVNRLAQPHEIAEFILFLLSHRAGFVTGSVHMVDGGYTAR